MRIAAAALVLLTVTLGSCTTLDHPTGLASAGDQHPEARLFDASRDANADVDGAISRAAENDKLALIVFGANWCHDSRAFAGWTETPRIGGLIEAEYELVFVNVGMPQTKDGHNLDVAERFGIKVVGTPSVLILSSLGEPINADNAGGWRNAGTRSEDAIYKELARYTRPAISDAPHIFNEPKQPANSM